MLKHCCGARAEAESRRVVRLAAQAQAKSIGAEGAGDYRELARFLDFSARDQGMSRTDLAELTGFDLKLINHALDFSGPFPLEALFSIAVVLDVSVVLRESMTIPEASARLAQAVEEHTAIDPMLARCLSRGKTADDFENLVTLFAGSETVINDEVRGQFVHALMVVTEALQRGDTNAAEMLLAAMIHAAEGGELREMTMPTLDPEVRAYLRK